MSDQAKQGIFLRAMTDGADAAVIDIVGVIGWDVAYGQLRDILRSIPESISRVVFDIYSPGGDVWEGNGIIQEIGKLGLRCQTEAHVQVAASMATLIAVACQERTIAANGRWLVHNPWQMVTGDADAMQIAADELRTAETEAAEFYAKRTGSNAQTMLELMDEERWLTAQEALTLGFVTRVDDPFAPEEYAAVRSEIEAAGQWPQGLAEIPSEETTEEGAANDEANETGENAEIDEDAPAGAPDKPAHDDIQDAAVADAYARGVEDGCFIGASGQLADIERLQGLLAAAGDQVRAHQSRADQAEARLEKEKQIAGEQSARLRNELAQATERLRRHLGGGLGFEPAVETWDEAMRVSGGDYARAAESYPELLKQYRAAQRQKGR